MSAPKRYVVEVRFPKAGERYLEQSYVCRSLDDHRDVVPVIVEELAPPPHPLAGTYPLIGTGGMFVYGNTLLGEPTHTLVIADDGTCTLTDIEVGP